jgi:hypothetical protein
MKRCMLAGFGVLCAVGFAGGALATGPRVTVLVDLGALA